MPGGQRGPPSPCSSLFFLFQIGLQSFLLSCGFPFWRLVDFVCACVYLHVLERVCLATMCWEKIRAQKS